MTAAHTKPIQHAIHALEVDLSIDGVNDSVARDSGHYTDWVRRIFLPIVEEVIEQSAHQAGLSNHQHQRIAKLEIDLGDIEADIADHEAERRLRAKLRDALMEQLRRHNGSAFSTMDANSKALISTAETPQSEQEAALLNYLKSGRLDWQFANHPRLAHKRLLQETLLRANDQRLFEEIRQHPTQLLRLVRQFDEADRFQLLKKQLGAWSSTEREYLLDWLSLELTLHGDQIDYCEDLWLHVLSNLNTTNIERTLRTLALGFYASKNIRAQVRFAEYKNDIRRRASEQHFSVDYAQSLLSNLAHLFTSESSDVDPISKMIEQRDETPRSTDEASLNTTETIQSSFIDTESALHAMLVAIARGDEATIQELLRHSAESLLQHLKRLHQDHAEIWQQNLSLKTKLALLQVLQTECAWIFNALANLDETPTSNTVLSEIIDYAIVQPVASLHAAALLDKIDTQYTAQLLAFTPFAGTIKDIDTAGADQILKYFEKLEQDSAGLATLRLLSRSQLRALIEKLSPAQNITALARLYPHQSAWVEAIIHSADSQTSNADFIGLNTLWRIIRAAMNLSYGTSLSHAVAHALLEIALHDTIQQANAIELTRKLLTHLRVLGVLKINSEPNLQAKLSSALQASLHAWMETEQMQEWPAATQALTEEIDNTPIALTTPLKGSWLLARHSEQALWVEHLVKNPHTAVQIYRHWQPVQRRELIQTLKPALRTSLIQALYPQKSLIIKELLQSLDRLKSLIGKAYGESLLARWSSTQIHRAVEDVLLGIAEGAVSTQTSIEAISNDLSAASLPKILADLFSTWTDRSSVWWHTALKQLLATPDTMTGSAARHSDSNTVPTPPQSLTQQARGLLPNLVNQLQVEQHQLDVAQASSEAVVSGQTHPLYAHYQAWLQGQTKLSALDLSLTDTWQFLLWWHAAHPQSVASSEWNALLSLYRLALDLPDEENVVRHATRDLLQAILREIEVAPIVEQTQVEKNDGAWSRTISEASLLAIEALSWRIKQMQRLQAAGNDARPFIDDDQLSTSATLARQDQDSTWHKLDLASLQQAQQILAALQIEQTTLVDLDRLEAMSALSTQTRAILRLEQLLGLRREFDVSVAELTATSSDPTASLAQWMQLTPLAQSSQTSEGLEKILAALIQLSRDNRSSASGTSGNIKTGQISAEQYQEFLNLWFQALGQAEAALPFLRCIEFYSAQISDGTVRARFTGSVLHQLLLQRDIDIERLLEQATLEQSTEAQSVEPDQPLSLGEDTVVRNQTSPIFDLQEDAIPLPLRQIQTIIANPAPAALEADLQESWGALSKQLNKPALRAWLIHYLSEQLLSNLTQQRSSASPTAIEHWRAILKRSLKQAQVAHLLLFSQLALHDATSERAQQLRRILRDEFSLTLDHTGAPRTSEAKEQTEQASSLPTTLKQWSTELCANFGIFSPDGVRDQESESMQSDSFAFAQLARQLYSSNKTASSVPGADAVAQSRSTLPRSWHEHLPQLLAEAMLSGHLAPLDIVWPVLVDQHGDALRRAQRQYLRQAQQSRRLVEQNPQDKVLDLISLNSQRFGHLVKLVLKAASVLQQGLPAQLDQASWQLQIIGFSYQASLQRDFLAKTPAHQLLSLLRQQQHWPKQAQQQAKETSLLRHIYYASLAHSDAWLSRNLAALLGERECLNYLAPQHEYEGEPLAPLATQPGLSEEQALITAEEVFDLLIENLGDSDNIANLIRDLNDEDSNALKRDLRNHLSRRLWSSADLQNQERLWNGLAQLLRAKARAMPSLNETATPAKNTPKPQLNEISSSALPSTRRENSDHHLAIEIEQFLPELLDGSMVTQLAEVNFAEHLVGLAQSSLPTANVISNPHTLAKLQGLLQSLSPLTSIETLWIRQIARRTVVEQADLLPQISHLLQQEHTIQRWCEALEPADLLYFLERNGVELVQHINRLAPVLRAQCPTAFETDGSTWSKHSLLSFYRLRFVLKQQDAALYVAQIFRTHLASVSPQKALEEFKAKIAEQEGQMQLKAQRAREQERERQRRSLDELKKRARLLGEEEEIPYGESNVQNAGMVIIAPYIQRLFSILELTKNNAFVDEQAAERAVHLLQYVVTGESSTPEYQLALNKLLCGIHGGVPIIAGIDISEHEKTVIEQMLNGVISNWSALGKTSIAGLRQTFLIREGQLSYDEDSWHLRIPTSTFDMLLDRLPWSFAMIRMPWMRAPLHVKWRASS